MTKCLVYGFRVGLRKTLCDVGRNGMILDGKRCGARKRFEWNGVYFNIGNDYERYRCWEEND